MRLTTNKKRTLILVFIALISLMFTHGCLGQSISITQDLRLAVQDTKATAAFTTNLRGKIHFTEKRDFAPYEINLVTEYADLTNPYWRWGIQAGWNFYVGEVFVITPAVGYGAISHKGATQSWEFDIQGDIYLNDWLAITSSYAVTQRTDLGRTDKYIGSLFVGLKFTANSDHGSKWRKHGRSIAPRR